MKKITVILALVAALLVSPAASAFEPDSNNKMQLAVAAAILDVRGEDPGIDRFFDGAAGYAVFPSVKKGGIGLGGARGKGLVIVGDEAVGRATLSQVTAGLQLGGQVYAQFIFFKDEAALKSFQRGNFEFGAQASAVAVTIGASADADYDKGVAVFTNVGGGLMYEATVSGQKFKYESL
jgi:lipid-binding SYLF domain-containing protein